MKLSALAGVLLVGLVGLASGIPVDEAAGVARSDAPAAGNNDVDGTAEASRTCSFDCKLFGQICSKGHCVSPPHTPPVQPKCSEKCEASGRICVDGKCVRLPHTPPPPRANSVGLSHDEPGLPNNVNIGPDNLFTAPSVISKRQARCTVPGQHRCAGNDRWIEECNPLLKWAVVHDCGLPHCCGYPGPKIGCICRPFDPKHPPFDPKHPPVGPKKPPFDPKKPRFDPRALGPPPFIPKPDSPFFPKNPPSHPKPPVVDDPKPPVLPDPKRPVLPDPKPNWLSIPKKPPGGTEPTIGKRDVGEETNASKRQKNRNGHGLPKNCWPGMHACEGSTAFRCAATRTWKILFDCHGYICKLDERMRPLCGSRVPRSPPKMDSLENVNRLAIRSTPELIWPTYLCFPGQYICGITRGGSGKGKPDAVAVCSPTGKWIVSALCGGSGCCQNGDPEFKTAFCTCGAEARGAEANNRLAIRSTTELIWPREECIPGQYTCGVTILNGNYPDAIAVCSPEGKWLLSALCGGPGCCRWAKNDGRVFCACGADSSNRLALRQTHDIHDHPFTKDPTDPTDKKCKPGSFTCYHDVLGTCDANGEWVITVICMPGCCQRGPNGTAFCTCGAEADDRLALRPTPDPSSKKCIPGQYSCGSTLPGKHEPDAVATCNANGEWVISARCGAPGCCQRGPNATAFCTCGAGANDRLAIRSNPDDSLSSEKCVPGQYSCGSTLPGKHEPDAIATCNPNGDWVISALCGAPGCCRRELIARAFCICGPAAEPNSKDITQPLDVAPALIAAPTLKTLTQRDQNQCTEGTHYCGIWGHWGKLHSVIRMCNKDGSQSVALVCCTFEDKIEKCCVQNGDYAHCIDPEKRSALPALAAAPTPKEPSQSG